MKIFFEQRYRKVSLHRHSPLFGFKHRLLLHLVCLVILSVWFCLFGTTQTATTSCLFGYLVCLVLINHLVCLVSNTDCCYILSSSAAAEGCAAINSKNL